MDHFNVEQFNKKSLNNLSKYNTNNIIIDHNHSYNDNNNNKSNNRSNIPAPCFGPPAWTFLHMLSFSYPDIININNPKDLKLKNDTFYFLVYFGLMLPCDICRDHYKEHLLNTDVYNQLNSKSEFIQWVYNLHDRVNKTLNKTSPSIEEVYLKYNDLISQSCNNKCNYSDYYCKVEIIKKNTENFDNVDTNNNMDSIYKFFNNKINIFLVLYIFMLLILILSFFN